MQAQILSGEYYLTGIPETGSGFMFTEDGRFEFFFSYGAVDRFATGTYTIEGDTVKLLSDKKPGEDFTIVRQTRKGEGFTIHIQEDNAFLANTVRAICFIGDAKHEAFAEDRRIHISESCDKIYLQHTLYPDIASLIKDETNSNNHFEVALKPDLQQVSFKGIDFFIEEDTLTCYPNYFMPFEKIRYVKR